MNTAVEDGIIRRNPCRVRGAGQDRSPERPVLTVQEVPRLAEGVGERYRALVLLAVFGSLRWGELGALRRRDLDVTTGAVQVERSLTEPPGGGYLFGPPKSAAGKRVVAIPAVIKPELAHHLETLTGDEPDALVFTAPTGTPCGMATFRRRVWLPALEATGLTGTHFHDLGHTGNHLTAATGATLRELIDRRGHSSPRAALNYLHGSNARQRAIADRLSKPAKRELQRGTSRRPRPGRDGGTGTQRARRAGSGS